MTRQSESTWGAFATVTLVASLVGGVFLLKEPLKPRRPKQQAELLPANLANEIVPARLWQDPLPAIQSHWRGIVSHLDERKVLPPNLRLPLTIKDLAKNSKTQESCRSELRLLVMMPGGPYAEDGEERRRQRHAVVSALTENDYIPEDAEHIGYLVAPGFNESCNGWSTSSQTFIGYERYKPALELLKKKRANKRDSNGGADCEDHWESIRVLWLNSEDFGVRPLYRIAALMAALEGKSSCDKLDSIRSDCRTCNPTTTVLLGPATSGGLKQMKSDEDCSQAFEGCQQAVGGKLANTAESNFLQRAKHSTLTDLLASQSGCDSPPAPLDTQFAQLKILSPRATVPLKWLFREHRDRNRAKSECYTNRLDADFHKCLGVASFNSVVARDDVVFEMIIKELGDRGAHRTGIPLIAIVSEQDSVYGRLLDDIFRDVAKNVKSGNGDDAETESKRKHDFDVREYGYLQGVDGELPPGNPILPKALRSTNDDDTASDRPIDSSFMATAHREPAFGVTQLDYVRRLADHIAYDISNEHKHGEDSSKGRSDENNGDPPVVIGILGTDVYDKLLILQALRERLPEATVFTTDLDARLTDPNVSEWTRNLIVGSAYGFTVEDLEGAGFRDSYQTALYRAVTLALKRKFEEPVPRPRLFEIGRTGAVDITTHETPWAKKTSEKVHGSTLDIRSRPDLSHKIISVLLVLIPLIALTIYAFRIWWVSDPKKLCFRRKAHRWVAVIGGVSIFLLVLLTCFLYSSGYEPWPFFEGVSSVPALILHLTTVIFTYGTIHIVLGRLDQGYYKIRDYFRVPSPSRDSIWCRNLWNIAFCQKPLSGPWICKWERELSGENQGKKKAEECWHKILEHSGLHATLYRISPSLIFVLLIGCVLLFAPGFLVLRPDPLLTRHLYCWMEVARHFAALAVIFTIFFCNDTLKLGQVIIRELVRHEITWANVRPYDPIRGQWQKMKLLVHFSKCVGPIAVLPFILISLWILAKSPLFEGWIWTPSVILPYAIMALYVLIRALRFQFEASRAKDAILASLDDYRLKFVSHRRKLSRIEIYKEKINGIHEGAFVPWTRQPILQSLLLPSGAYGIFVLLDTFF